MARDTLLEHTADEVLVSTTRKFFPAQSFATPAIPSSFDGDHALLVVLATDGVNPSEAQMDALESSIEAITGIKKAFVLKKGRVPLDRVPAGNDLTIEGAVGFEVRPTPVTPE